MAVPMPAKNYNTNYGCSGGNFRDNRGGVSLLKILLFIVCICLAIYTLIPYRGYVVPSVTNSFFSPNYDEISIDYCVENQSNKISRNNSVTFSVVGEKTGTLYGKTTIQLPTLFFNDVKKGSVNIRLSSVPSEAVRIEPDFNGFYTGSFFLGGYTGIR